jgi:hypothetical protein
MVRYSAPAVFFLSLALFGLDGTVPPSPAVAADGGDRDKPGDPPADTTGSGKDLAELDRQITAGEKERSELKAKAAALRKELSELKTKAASLRDPPGFYTKGYRDTNCYVFPSLDLVVARMQNTPGPEGAYEPAGLKLIKAIVPPRRP